MANFATVIITIEDAPFLDDTISFQLRRKSNNAIIRQIIEIAKFSRTAPYTFAAGPYKEVTAINLRNAINTDYGAHLIATSSENIVTVTALEYGYYFDLLQWSGPFDLSFVDEVLPVPDFAIESISFDIASSNPCDNIKVILSVNLDLPPYRITSPVIKDAANASQLFFDFQRYSVGSRIATVIGDYGGDNLTASLSIPLVRKYSIGSVSVKPSLSGATIVINRTDNGTGVQATSFNYSLDGVTYQDSPVFPGILGGDYTAYMIDEWGCISTYEFSVPALTGFKPAPYFYIERANPLRFVPVGNFAIKNIENTLFNDLRVPNVEKRFFRQPFQYGRPIYTQIKTNYDNVLIEVLDCSNEVVETVTPELKIQNVGLQDKRDCYIKSIQEGKTGVYFVQGNIYDPSTNDIIDTYFESSGRLPSFVNTGMFVELASANLTGIFQVESIAYDNELMAWGCVVNVDYAFEANAGIALSIYDLENFNIHEFSLNLDKGQYKIRATATDNYTGYDTIVWMSEPIYIEELEDVVSIIYSANDNQSGIDYRTLIVYELFVPGRFVKYNQAGNDELFENDNGNNQLQKSVYIRTLEIETNPIPFWLAEKMTIASGHPNLLIDNIEAVRPEKPEITGLIDENNPFYTLTCVFEEKKQLVISELVGIVSGQRYVLGINENTVIGL